MTARTGWLSRHGLVLGGLGLVSAAIGGAATSWPAPARRALILMGCLNVAGFVLGIAAEEHRRGVATLRWGESGRTEARYYRAHEPVRFAFVLAGRVACAGAVALIGVLASLSSDLPG